MYLHAGDRRRNVSDLESQQKAVRDTVLLALQKGVRCEREPFAALGEELGVPGKLVLATARAALAVGDARRFGAVLDSRRLGYTSTLCALSVPRNQIDEVAARLIPHSGVTHCYERDGLPNLWFTLTVPSPVFEQELQQFRSTVAPLRIVNLPARRRFKIATIFDLQHGRAHGTPTPGNQDEPGDADPLTTFQKALIRQIHGSIQLSARPFDAIADALGCSVERVLEQLEAWIESGTIRRVALVVNHRRLGFTANAMCVWRVADSEVEHLGQLISQRTEITHCYERPPSGEVPYNLFAMIHANSISSAREMFEDISISAGLPPGKILVSKREFKKSSPEFFRDEDA